MQYSAAVSLPHDGKFAPLAGYAFTGETLLIANVDVAKTTPLITDFINRDICNFLDATAMPYPLVTVAEKLLLR
jgi:hypothetical protein